MKDTDAAWAAGFLDGEATFTARVTESGTFHVTVLVSQVMPAPLLKLKELFGGNIHQRPAHGNNGRPFHVWALKGPIVLRAMLTAILPYLVLKDKHAQMLLEACDLMGVNGRMVTTDVLRDRIEISERFREANKRGAA